jgi:hypothetical protein
VLVDQNAVFHLNTQAQGTGRKSTFSCASRVPVSPAEEAPAGTAAKLVARTKIIAATVNILFITCLLMKELILPYR